jgi:hypothetical protein
MMEQMLPVSLVPKPGNLSETCHSSSAEKCRIDVHSLSDYDTIPKQNSDNSEERFLKPPFYLAIIFESCFVSSQN